MLPNSQTQAPSPERIMAMLNGFQQTAILKGAIELGVFSEIAVGHNRPCPHKTMPG